MVTPTVFDATEGRSSGLRGALLAWLWDRVPALAALLRTVWPNLRLGRFIIVTRRDDIEEVLSKPELFQTRVGIRLEELQKRARIKGPPPAFELCSDDEDAHTRASKTAAAVLRLDDAGNVGRIVRSFVSERSNAAGLDLGTLLLEVSAQVARRYVGIYVEPHEFLELSLCCQAIVSYAFGTGGVDSSMGRLGAMGAGRLSELLRRSIERDPIRGNDRTIIGRLVGMGLCDSQTESAATLITMALVAVPTVSSMNAVRLLLSRPEAMRIARAAAMMGDDVALGRCLREALRLNYISPGLMRTCTSDFVIAAGTGRRMPVSAGDTVLPATLSGMLDASRVEAATSFRPDRPTSDETVFGLGRHRCAGFAAGHVMMVSALKPLLRRGLWQTRSDRRAVSWFGHYQEHFPVRLG